MVTVNQELVQVKYSMVAGQYGGQLIFPSDWVRAELAESMLAMPSEADLFTQTVGQKYPIGTQLRKNAMLFRYCKAGATMGVGHQGSLKVSYLQTPDLAGASTHNGCATSSPVVAVVAGDTSIKIVDAAAVKNEYENATLIVYDDTNLAVPQYTILGNDVSDGTNTMCYIAPPGFKYAIPTTGIGITAYLNPYSKVHGAVVTGTNFYSAIGYARLSITDDYYFWMQTAGPITGLTMDSGYTAGITAYGRDVFANTDGSLYGQASTARYYQRIGYLLGGTSAEYADNFIMLQLDQ